MHGSRARCTHTKSGCKVSHPCRSTPHQEYHQDEGQGPDLQPRGQWTSVLTGDWSWFSSHVMFYKPKQTKENVYRFTSHTHNGGDLRTKDLTVTLGCMP